LTLNFSRYFLFKEYQDDIQKFNLLSAQAGKPVPPGSLGLIGGISVERHFCKRLNSLLIAF
jgi:hypothetical protein